MNDLVEMECLCDSPKTFRITMDSGSQGHYVVVCCNECRKKEDFRFMIKEEVLKGDVMPSTLTIARSEDVHVSV